MVENKHSWKNYETENDYITVTEREGHFILPKDEDEEWLHAEPETKSLEELVFQDKRKRIQETTLLDMKVGPRMKSAQVKQRTIAKYSKEYTTEFAKFLRFGVEEYQKGNKAVFETFFDYMPKAMEYCVTTEYGYYLRPYISYKKIEREDCMQAAVESFVAGIRKYEVNPAMKDDRLVASFKDFVIKHMLGSVKNYIREQYGLSGYQANHLVYFSTRALDLFESPLEELAQAVRDYGASEGSKAESFVQNLRQHCQLLGN